MESKVESNVNQGTTFTALPPWVECEIEEKKQLNVVLTGTKNILVVDDEEQLLITQKRLLERLGYTITAMSNSLEALELFKKDPQKFDLIITDLTMPYMTGDRLSSEVIAIRSDMPIILSTGDLDAINDESIKQRGIKSFIPKPCQKAELEETIRLVLDGEN